MNERSLSVLLAQLRSRANDVDANLAVAIEVIDDHPQVDLAVFPEMFANGYALRGMRGSPVDVTLPPFDSLAQCARRNSTAVIIGAAQTTDEGTANSAVCIDERGEISGCYQKVHLFGAEHRFFHAGDRYLVTTLAGVKIAPLICYDVEFPEPARAVVTAGAELLVTISANMDPYAVDHALCLRVRALENRVPHVYVNLVGSESRLVFCGGSGVADASGRLVASLAPYRPDLRVVEVTVGEHPEPDYLAEVRTGIPVAGAGSTTLERSS